MIVAKPHQEHITNISNLYGVWAYPIRSLTRSRNFLNFQYPIVTMQSEVLVRALIQFLSSDLTPARVTIKFKCEKSVNKSQPYLPQITHITGSMSFPLAQQMYQDSTLPL